MAPPRNPKDTKKSEHPLRDLLMILGILLAALQVIPIYVSSKGVMGIVIAGVLLVCVLSFVLLRYTGRLAITWRQAILPSMLVTLVGGVALYSQITLRNQITKLSRSASEERIPDVLLQYLDHVVDDHASQWNGEFEKKYARPTLYLLSATGNEAKPTDVQNSILLWRSGSEGVGTQFMGVAGLAGETLPGSSKDITRTAQRYMSYVQRPMADSDFLNRNSRGTQSPNGAADNVPDRVLVLGDPASGKSSMLDRLDMIQARRARGSTDEAVPVLIRVKGLADPTPEVLREKITERLGACAELVLGRRRIVLLIDALDEAADPAAAVIAIGTLLDSEPFGTTVERVIVTGRVLNYTSTLHTKPEALRYKGFNTAILYGLDQTSIEKRILGSTLATDQKANIMKKLALASTRSAWLQFLRMPMNFDLISEIMGDLDSDEIEQGQTEILRRFVAHRFEHKELNISEAAAGNELLRQIALRMLEGGVAGRSRDFRAEDGLPAGAASGGERIQFEEQTKQVDRRLLELEKTGLIRQSMPGNFRFFHLNLQDFFIAEGLNDLTKVDPRDVAWRQILLFYAGKKDGGSLVELIEDARQSTPSTYLDDLLQQVIGIREHLDGISTR